jgi:hypothetical protein
MLKFTVNNDNVCIDPNIKIIQEFNNILKHGKSIEDEDHALRMLLYVFYCCDLTEDNVMRDLDFRMKEEQSMVRAFRNKKTEFTKRERELIEAAIDAYNFFNETSAERAILSIDAKIDEARSELDDFKIERVRNVNEGTGVVTFASNISEMGTLTKQIGEMMTLKVSITNAAKKLENSGRVRGGKGSSLIERGNLVRKNEE